MTDEELKKLKDKYREELSMLRYILVDKFPFAGNIALRMDLIPVRDKRMRTACTDGKKVYFDMDFLSDLSNSERVFVLAHEVWHCVMMHLVRCQSRNVDLFNIASDMEVNYLLSIQPKTAKTSPIIAPEGCLFPPKEMEGKSAEVIYEYLLKQQKNQNQSKQQSENTIDSIGDDFSNSQSSSSSSEKKKRKKSSSVPDWMKSFQNKDESSKNSDLSKKDGKKTGKLEGQFDSHKYGNSTIDDIDKANSKSDESGNESDCSLENTITDQWGEVGYDKDFTPSVSSDFADKMRETIVSEMQRAERMQGTTPAGFDEFLEEIKKPEIRWQEVLAQFVTSCYNGKRRWLPPSRRHVYNEIYLQSRRQERINVTVAIDTSGSCLGDLPKFFGELNSLLKSFGDYELNLICCDAKVDSFETYSVAKPFPIDDAKAIKYSGGGGTSFKPPFKYVRENGIQSDCFIYFTDGYGDAPTYPPPYPVLWILTADGDDSFCSWGRKLRFKNYDE